MKNCPKCGAPIFDNKNRCFACGADLTAANNAELVTDDGFADSFFAQIGGVVSTEKDSVLNDSPVDVTTNVNDVSNKKNIDNQNVMVVDNQSQNESFNSILGAYISEKNNQVQEKQQKIFSITKEKKEVTATETVQQTLQQVPQQPQTSVRQPVVQSAPVQAEPDHISKVVAEAYDSQIPKPVSVEPVHVEAIATPVAPIDENGEFVEEKKKTVETTETEEKPKPKVNSALIFNMVCLGIFLLIVGFVYFNYLREPDDTHTELGGLTYELNSDFELVHENSGSKYYTYKSDNCSIRVSFVAANDDSVLNSFFVSSKEHFANNPNYNFQNDSIKINNNTWESLSVIEMPNGSVIAPTLRYKYSAIVYNATFYTIAFVNLNNDDYCTEMYNDFNNSLIFY